MYSVDLEKPYSFVYMIVNQSLPNWVKIGISKDIRRRMQQGNTFVPTPFKLHRAWVTNDARYAETLCHTALKDLRAETGRELFQVKTSVDELYEVYGDGHVEYIFQEFPLDDLADYIELEFMRSGIAFEHALHPDLEL